MSHQPNQSTPGNNGSSAPQANPPHSRRAMNSRGQPQYGHYGGAQPVFIPADYAAAGAAYAAAPYQAAGYYNGQYYTPQGYPPAPNMSPVPGAGMYRGTSEYASGHPLNVTTPAGVKVELDALTPKSAHASLNRSAATTPKMAATPLGHQRTPSINSPAPAPANPEAEKMKDIFKQKVAERLRLRKEKEAAEAAAAASASGSTPAPAPVKKEETPAPAAVASTPSPAPKEEEAAKENVKPEDNEAVKKFKEAVLSKAKPVVESKPEPVVESKTEEIKEETKAETTEKAAPVTEEKKEEEKPEQKPEATTPAPAEEATQETASEEKKVEEETTTAPTTAESETQPESEATKEEQTAEEKATEASVEDGYTISKFLEVIKSAKPIEDPFSFEYPEAKARPDEHYKSEKVAYRYDPVFLLQFKDQCVLPLDQKFEEQIKFITVSQRNDRSASSRGGFSFGKGSGISGTQGFSKSNTNLRRFDSMNSRSNSRTNSKRRGGSGKGDRKSNRNRERDFEREREPEVPAEPVKPLEKSANRWVPKSRAAKKDPSEIKYAPDGVTVLLDETEIKRKTQSLLNKLTLEHFDDITDELMEIANQSKWENEAETLTQVINFTFDKATDEPHWSNMYAQFCAKMCKMIDPEVKHERLIKGEDCARGGQVVRTLLLSKCQAEYEKGWTDKLPTNEDGTPFEPELMTDEYYKAAAAKRRGLGLVRFIGHLFVLNMLSENIIFACLAKLIKNVEDPTEDTVENLVQMIKTVGPKIDESSEVNRSKMNHVFAAVEQLSEAKIPSRLQFSLMDLIDLRKNRWRGSEADKGPKTIKEIHEEERKKAMEEQRQSDSRRKQGRNDSRQSSSRNAGWGNSSRVSDSDFKRFGQVNTTSSSSNLGPMNNFQKTKSLRSQKSSSSNLAHSNTPTPVESSRENSKRPEKANMFDALMGGDEEESHEEAPAPAAEAEAEAEAEVEQGEN